VEGAILASADSDRNMGCAGDASYVLALSLIHVLVSYLHIYIVRLAEVPT